MTKLPKRTTPQDSYIKTGLRVPPDLHKELVDSAARAGHSMNAEILTRLLTDRTGVLMAELAVLRAMVQKLIDRN